MAFSSEAIGQILASGRHYVSTTVGFIGGIGIMSAAQSKGVGDSVNQIFDGLKMIFEGGSNLWAILVTAFPLIGVLMAKMASKSASVPSQAAALKAAVEDPNTAVPPEAQKAIVEATSVIAQDAAIPTSKEAKVALLDATAALPEVVSEIKVADPELVQATVSTQIKPAA